jgi:hypothetical protein
MKASEHLLRHQYISLIEDLFRELDLERPDVTHDPDLPLALILDVNSTPFKILHSPGNRNFLLSCEYHTSSGNEDGELFSTLLCKNICLTHNGKPTFALNSDEVAIRILNVPLDGMTAISLLMTMGEIAEETERWIETENIDAVDSAESIDGFELNSPGVPHLNIAL